MTIEYEKHFRDTAGDLFEVHTSNGLVCLQDDDLDVNTLHMTPDGAIAVAASLVEAARVARSESRGSIASV